MQLSLQNFTTLVENMASAVQGAAAQALDMTVGSVLRAILEANASLALWMQWLIVQVLASTRLATSNGLACDSFGADFGFTRLPAVAAVGQVTFSRFTPSGTALVPSGVNVSTAGNGQSFVVLTDVTNAAYDAGLAGYVLAAGLGSVVVPVAANVAGAGGNVQAGSIAVLRSTIPGIDVVTNVMPLSGGFDAETDAAFRGRFSNYLGSLARATDIAIGTAIAAIQQGLSYVISENVDQAGNTQIGHFVVIVDDGSGNPPTALLGVVQQAVDLVRPVGTSFAVQKPVITAANVAMTLTTSIGASHALAVAAVAGAVEQYIAGLGIGVTLNYTRLAQLAYAASPVVTNVSGVLLNDAVADLAPPEFGVVRVGIVAVS